MGWRRSGGKRKSINAYTRDLCLVKRIQCVQMYLLSKIWYAAQTLPPPIRRVKQMTTVCTSYIWQEAPLRVPVTTLQRSKEQGGWYVTDIENKCKALHFSSLWSLSKKAGSTTAALTRHWNLSGSLPNPPHANYFPTKITHFRQYAIDMAYVAHPEANKTGKQFKRRLYGVLRTTTAAKDSTT